MLPIQIYKYIYIWYSNVKIVTLLNILYDFTIINDIIAITKNTNK